MKKLLLASIIASGFVAHAYAATETQTFQSTAEVSASCTITTNPLAFGAINPSVANTATATISVACTNGTTGTVALSSANAWVMKDTATTPNELNYGIFQNSGHTTAWDATTTQSITGAGLGTTTDFTAYGQITAQPAAKVSNSYSDTVTVTVTY